MTDATTFGPLIRQYVGERLRRGEITPLTARNVRNHLYAFDASYGRRPLDQLSHKAVERWIEDMHRRHLAPGTQNARLSSLRCFARWCAVNKHVGFDWTLNAPKVRRPRAQARDVTNEHFHLVLAQARSARERLIVWLMFDAGLRCIEISRLTCEDVERDTCQVFVTGKANHQRYVPVSAKVMSAIDDYLDEVGHGPGSHRTGPLVRREDTAGALGPERISGIVGHLFKLSGVKARPYDGRSAHGLRAAAATDLYEACRDPRTVQEFLGHADMQNLNRYISRATVEKVREAQRMRPHVASS